ncbi:MAG TPA: hypothetical protein PK580_00050 [Nitrosomonas halophila]|nr:hypothetical protein [Nitrosomonas halophila]
MKKIYHSTLTALLFLFSANSFSTSVIYAPVPKEINELVETSDIIVVGTFGDIIDTRQFYGYQESAAYIAELDKTVPYNLGTPLVDIQIHITEVIKSDDQFRSGDQSKVTFRYFEDADSARGPESTQDREGEKLFFLTMNPDNGAYGSVTVMHVVHLDDAEHGISYSDPGSNLTLRGNRRPIPFTASQTPGEFLNEVREALNSR